MHANNTINRIRCAWTIDGEIEAAVNIGGVIRNVIIDVRTGELLRTNVSLNDDLFRWLIRAARQHKAV